MVVIHIHPGSGAFDNELTKKSTKAPKPPVEKETTNVKSSSTDDQTGKWSTLGLNDLKLLLSARNLGVSGSKDELIKKLQDYEHWDKFTIKELKNELGNRNLAISGSKDELIQRLIEGGKEKKAKAEKPPATPTVPGLQHIAYEEAERPQKKAKKASAFDEFSVDDFPNSHVSVERHSPVASVAYIQPAQSVQFVHAIPALVPPVAHPLQVQEEVQKVKKAPAMAARRSKPIEETLPVNIFPTNPTSSALANKPKKRKAENAYEKLFSQMTIYELKAALSERDLKLAGNKDELVERLVAFEEINSMSTSALEDELTARGLPISGSKRDLVDRMSAFEELDNKTIYELKAELSAKNLSCSGNKDELILRLLYCKTKR